MKRLVGLIQVFHENNETVAVVTVWKNGDALTEHVHRDGYKDISSVKIELESSDDTTD